MSEALLRCAVIGAGKMGSLHARKYAATPGCELTAVVDPDADAAVRAAAPTGALPLTDYRGLLGRVDAVSITVPTSLHYPVARDFLEAGAHVLVEKPITVTVEEADALIALARRRGRVLQVGHIERFNAALMQLDLAQAPLRFIEATRIAPFTARGADVSVVLDLMIHDIDLILALVDAEVERVDAVGAPVFTDAIDIANARLAFANGCVANVTASRASQKVERRMRLFLTDGYAAVDFHNRSLQRVRLGEPRMRDGVPNVMTELKVFDGDDPLATEIQCFLACARSGAEPPSSGMAGRRALALATRIGQLLDRRSPDEHRRTDA